MFESMCDSDVVSAIGDSARSENIACARRVAAVAELYDRRQVWVQGPQDRRRWSFDVWDVVAAEIAAAQASTPAAASALLHVAVCLHQRLPKVAALFATGALTYRDVALIVNRTLLALAPDVLADIDAELAEALPRWGVLSRRKTEQHIDALIEAHDPDARRRTETTVRSRFLDIEQRGDTATITGDVLPTDAALLDHRLTALAKTVCPDDPRTINQRRADALGALAAGHDTLTCACGSEDCPAADSAPAPAVLIHVLAEQATIDAPVGDLHGKQPSDGPEFVTDPARAVEIIRESRTPKPAPEPAPEPMPPNPKPGLTLGGPIIPAAILADLVRRGIAEIRPVKHPGDGPPEPRYRPSRSLADFIRCRDMTCRWPGCDCPAQFCDIDHTIPYDVGGLTHSSNLKLYCRRHHRTCFTHYTYGHESGHVSPNLTGPRRPATGGVPAA
ncbi:DUF222 domain-containing protein [Mycobacterium sp. M1]|uniref:DUF222 domain-containing protein n=1 Tax=Mycolicibacter acidiphilus TaxID=2835306 RepID=A0ABS5RGX0_9MYCO|nr:HNH endonuclease signature motif containing protein [Mycolicibacter acidiphilus]MBS9533548.1 DUF222 domain-containing protein [Mycolicibacter acidiphilus]